MNENKFKSKLAISNIGWDTCKDLQIYELMREYGYYGLEIAPTKIIPETPYDRISEAKSWFRKLNSDYNFVIPSMQSIWFGRQEKLFGSAEERTFLYKYTEKAIDFAVAIGCNNLVFGCPRNRFLPENCDIEVAYHFFKSLGDYAASVGTVIGMEANPPIYNTNYINDTQSAIELVERVNSQGFRLNLDIGTMIENKEMVQELKNKVHLINHVHISEPGLALIEKRELHLQLRDILMNEGYQGYISIEMGKRDNIEDIENSMKYIAEVFG